MRSNAVAWNPQEPMNFVCANEDTNLYTFDLRNLNQVGTVIRCALKGMTNLSKVLSNTTTVATADHCSWPGRRLGMLVSDRGQVNDAVRYDAIPYESRRRIAAVDVNEVFP